jgi:hypothetical protein
MEFPVGVSPRVSSVQSPSGFALRILENGAVIARIGGLVVVTRAKRAQITESRICEIGLRGKECVPYAIVFLEQSSIGVQDLRSKSIGGAP